MRPMSWLIWTGMLSMCLMIAGCGKPLFSPVPDLVGQTQAAATAAILDAQLIVGKITQECSNTIDSGLVIRQSPPPGLEQATFAGSVTLVVSSGRCNVTVPNVVGMTKTAALSAITGAHLTPGTAAETYHATVAVGLVISQAPSANGEALYGSVVDLVVSLGPQPITGTIVIDDDHTVTNSPQATLKLTWSGGGGTGVIQMRFSDDGAHWTDWEAVQATRAYTLPGADEYKTVRVQYKDSLGNTSPVFNDFIRLDTTPPTGTIIINNGDTSTTSPSVTLGLTWTDGTGVGVTRMRFSDDGAHWTDWEALLETRAYTLPDAVGYHTVRVQFRDGADNDSEVYDDYIKLLAP